ncbi:MULTISPECIES: NO-inducible flavohemoprotein [Oceanobacillus]|uniref:Flavohemoprotein n=1 Tax=Oceanobacillus profundus TaxID=372463 RepID=A0A417YHC5_9BACI|nr:NO-inducible flavohemoprotein [Oceanobacillus profundus]MCM3398047.1 NO-inducible flavohemoprotein [Oceanobacillus profundus]PAE27320.1 nitric oxide dioxygenase [Paenibacillus sp. 7884-2]RHW32213.1 NO-inducible flavohemoprotein [Oceanobacillus profundus]
MTTETATGLDQKTRDIIKATVPVLEEHGTAITKRFYQMMFENHPELKNIFNQTNQRKGDQPKALANTVYAAAVHIDNLEAILPVVKQIAQKHRSLNIKPEHYPIVGENLLLAIKDVLGDAATDEIIDAWAKAYGVIADVFISVEAEMYTEVKATTGGWIDYRNFKVIKKEVESDVITSFYLQPEDGEAFPSYQPGQYITVKAVIDGENYNHLRQYSLSCAPGGEFYRISVKREDAFEDQPKGVVSSFLHEHINEGDILPISAPAGDFFLDAEDTRPLVLMSGGVGLTPMISMLETAIKEQPEREVIYIHAAKSSKFHAMKERVKEIAGQNNHVKSYTVYDSPSEGDSFDKAGRIDYDWLSSILPTNDAAFYFCGPKGFMRAMYQHLKAYQVNDTDIHFEIFGPSEDITR